MSFNPDEVKEAINAYYKKHKKLPHLFIRRNEAPAFIDECLQKGIKVSVEFKQRQAWRLE